MNDLLNTFNNNYTSQFLMVPGKYALLEQPFKAAARGIEVISLPSTILDTVRNNSSSYSTEELLYFIDHPAEANSSLMLKVQNQDGTVKVIYINPYLLGRPNIVESFQNGKRFSTRIDISVSEDGKYVLELTDANFTEN